jgi:hypothetical protein
MAGELIPPPGRGPSLSHLDSQECIRLWIDLMETCDELLLAGLRASIGEHGDLRAAYRQWYEAQRLEHDKMILRMAERLRQAQDHSSDNASGHAS